MAVIWRIKNRIKIFKGAEGRAISEEEIRLAEEYDSQLRKKMEEIAQVLEKKGFFRERNTLKKWHMLGRELQFLDNFELRKKCDPEMKYTWRALLDISTRLAPSQKLPRDRERLEGRRNHFYMCYILGKFDLEKAIQFTWSEWNDIFMSFSPEMWRDGERLLEWLISRSRENGKVSREKLRKALKALRSVCGERATKPVLTQVLSKEELYKLLDKSLSKFR
jgi:hypothetical protein